MIQGEPNLTFDGVTMNLTKGNINPNIILRGVDGPSTIPYIRWVSPNNLHSYSAGIGLDDGNFKIGYSGATNSDIITNTRFTINSIGNIGIGGVVATTAKLHIGSGGDASGSAPLKLTSGALLASTEVGAIEYRSPTLYFTNGDLPGGLPIRLRIPTVQAVYLNGVQSRTSITAYSDLTGLSVSLTAGRRYEIEAFVSIIAVAGAGAKLRFFYSGTMTSINTFSYTISDANTFIETRTTSGTAFAGDEVTSSAIANAGFFFKGHIQASTAGVLSLQAAQNTSTINTAFFDTGGFIKVTPI